MDRARITVTDVVYIMMAVAALAAFYPVYYYVLGGSGLTGNNQLLFSTLLPLAVLVILGVIIAEAKTGLR